MAGSTTDSFDLRPIQRGVIRCRRIQVKRLFQGGDLYLDVVQFVGKAIEVRGIAGMLVGDEPRFGESGPQDITRQIR